MVIVDSCKFLLVCFIFVLGIFDVGEEIVKLLVCLLGLFEWIGKVFLEVLIYLLDVGVEVVYEIYNFFVDEYNCQVIVQLCDVEYGVQLQEEGEVVVEFVVCVLLVGFIDKLNIFFIVVIGVEKLVSCFGLFDGIICVDWFDLCQVECLFE